MRVSGLASGMDTESIIRDMMKANRIPLDKVTQKKQYLEWQLNDYRSINRDLQSAAYKIRDTVGRPGAFSAKTMTISNPDAVNIKSLSASSEFSGKISVTRLATQATWQSTGSDSTKNKSGDTLLKDMNITGNKITIEAPNAKGEMESKDIEFDPTVDTMDSLMGKINKDPDANVNAFYDSFSGKISFTAKNSGEGSIKVSGLVVDGLNDAGTKQDGLNAEFKFNGLTTERRSNTFTINGFEINLKQVTTSDVTFSSAPDTDKVMDSVVQFVNDYNKMIEDLNAKLSEKKYRDFPALSDEQKKDMKENEIKLWEEKAMSGTLRNDPIISSMLTKMRSALNSNDQGGLRLSDIGITTSKNFKDNGKLVIDEDKLRKAITEDPTKVSQIFNRPSTETDKGGVAVGLRVAMEAGQKAIAARAGSAGAGNSTFSLGRMLKGMDDQINRFEDRLKMVENRLWKQFGAMEQAIQRANAQSAQLMSSLGGGM